MVNGKAIRLAKGNPEARRLNLDELHRKIPAKLE